MPLICLGGKKMNKLFFQQRKCLAIVLAIEILVLGTLVSCTFLRPEFPYYRYIAIGLACLFTIIDYILAISFNVLFRRNKGRSEMKAGSILGTDINEAYNFGQIGLAVCDHNNTVLWINDFLGSRFTDLVDENIFKVFPKLEMFADPKYERGNEHPRIQRDNRTYEVELIPEARLFIFRDITDFANIYTYNQKQSPVIGYIAIDNYYDVQMHVNDDTKFIEMQNAVHSMITEFATQINAMLRKLKDDRYFFITTKENYEKIYQDKFPLVSQVAKRYPHGFTLSIGVALGFPDYAKLSSMASSALDVALSRGGDQTVVDNHGQPLQFFGGKTDLLPSRNRVKTRILSNSFITILKNYRNVIVMGHQTADFDAMGSALGVKAICDSVNVPCRICFEDQLVEDKCRRAIELEFEEDEIEETFVNMREIDSLIHEKTLLVLVDHSNPKISIFADYVSKFDNIAVIDHHRPGAVVVNSPVFEDVDTSASSASEILTSLISYNPNLIQVDERTATFLLTGISLDTQSFREHATNSTFEAAAQLKLWSADSIKVVDFLKEEFEEYRQKIAILDNSEVPYSDVFVSVSDDDDIVSEITLSRVADEAISVRGISVSFCIGRITPHRIKVSARSDGSVNCGTLMEKLHGGGRFTMAATTVDNTTVEEVKKKLLEVIKEYLDDARIHDVSKK